MSQPGATDVERLVRELDAHPDYRVLRRLPLRDAYHAPDGCATVAGLVVDVETTGLDTRADAIIELGAIKFEFDPESGRTFRIVDCYSALEDPGRPIPPDSTAVHGITDAMVAGRRIDDARVRSLLQGVHFVVAHNAQFDRPFLERRLAAFRELPWACSLRDIDWRDEGYGNASLEYLAYRRGFFFDGHRSEDDCRALLEVVQAPLSKSGRGGLAVLAERIGRNDMRILALRSPFETKDLLRERGYRWDAQEKVWHVTVSGKVAVTAEVAWLKAEVFKRDRVELEFERLDALTRYSGRPGRRERRTL